jgi:PAS domain S-box-containing protein
VRPTRRFSFVNLAARRILGYAPDDHYADPELWLTLVDPADRPVMAATLAGQVTAQPCIVRWRHPDGYEVWTEHYTSVVYDADGAPLAIEGVARDITGRMWIEEAAPRLEGHSSAARVKMEATRPEPADALLAAAHDLRQPLTTIQAHAELLLRRSRDRGTVETDALRRGLAGITRAVARMASDIDALVGVTQITSGHGLLLELGPTDLVALAREAADEQQLATTRHRLRVETATEQLVGRWDKTRLRRVLDNLLGNAIRYSPDGGEIAVGVARSRDPAGTWAMLTVRDSGLGIPAADLPHVFDLYRRGRNVVDRVPGSGIGLAGVRNVVTQHGGTIEAESTEGNGSCFTVRLPLGR